MTAKKQKHWASFGRADILLLFGLAGLTYETVFTTLDRPYLLGVFGYMIGIPWLLRIDRLFRGEEEKK